MNAEPIARALGGRKVRGGWTARCPAHDDRNPSLSICDQDGRVLVRCHPGCQQAKVIAVLRRRGLWTKNCARWPSRTGHRKLVERKPDHDEARRTEAALAIWQSAKPTQSTPVETYLEAIQMNRCAFALAGLVKAGANEAPLKVVLMETLRGAIGEKDAWLSRFSNWVRPC